MRYRVGLFLKIGAIVLFAFAGLFLFSEGMYFTAALPFLGILLLAFSIGYSYRKMLRRMEQMIAAIRYGDLNIAFSEQTKGEEGALNRSMNEALFSFRSRLYQNIVTEAETEAWQKLIRVLTHEIMNSLAPIISLSETVTERAEGHEPDEKEYKIMFEAMQSIQRRSHGLREFVENYRRLTRIPAPVMRVFPVEELFRTIRGLLPENPAAVVYSIVPADMRLFADRTLIEQVLINLIKNAMEATESVDVPEIRVKAFREAGKPVIAVSDNGQGIVSEAMDRIFVPFYTTKPGGSGIGLSLSRQIMNRHKGTITGSSEPGKGSVFRVHFP